MYKRQAGRLLCALTFHNASIAHFSFSRQSIFPVIFDLDRRNYFLSNRTKFCSQNPFLCPYRNLYKILFLIPRHRINTAFFKKTCQNFFFTNFCSLHPVSGMFCVKVKYKSLIGIDHMSVLVLIVALMLSSIRHMHMPVKEIFRTVLFHQLQKRLKSLMRQISSIVQLICRSCLLYTSRCV